MVLDQVGKDAVVAVRIGIARARFEMRRACARQQRPGVLPAEDAVRHGTLQHGQGPVVAQARLVVAEMCSFGALAADQRQVGVERAIEPGRIADRVEQYRAGEVFADRADRQQRA
ncbi:hypothetical protein D3C72_1902450 [compost metagenome]